MTGKVELHQGNGGTGMQKLIERLTHTMKQTTDTRVDAAPFLDHSTGQWLTTTDGFTVDPLIFPGGSIGSLAVNGTVNDLAVAGAIPKWLTLNLFLEEGLALSLLDQVMSDLAHAAMRAEVQIIAGDTKVLPRGQIPGLLMATTGLGVKKQPEPLGLAQIQPGDQIVTSGPLGDHGAAVMLAREDFGLTGKLRSCCAPVTDLAQAALGVKGLRFMRDPTRGGLVTILHDMAQHCALTPVIYEDQLPIDDATRALCQMLGYEPLTLASEGRVIAIVESSHAEKLVHRWHQLDSGKQACVIGEIRAGQDDPVMRTVLGGETYLPPLTDDPLPRIC